MTIGWMTDETIQNHLENRGAIWMGPLKQTGQAALLAYEDKNSFIPSAYGR
jgi:hypothetical protein